MTNSKRTKVTISNRIRSALSIGATAASAAFALGLFTPATAQAAPPTVGEACTVAGNGRCWPYCNAASCRKGITANNSTISGLWNTWRNRHIVNAPYTNTPAGQYRVWKSDPTGTEGNTTVSEGMAYGMLGAVMMDEEELLSGLWNWYKGHRTSKNKDILMNWCYKRDGSSLCGSSGSASDASVDAALALVFACAKQTIAPTVWLAAGSTRPAAQRGGTVPNYCTAAQAALADHWTYEYNTTDGTMLSGDSWATTTLNPSYYSPGHWLAFQRIEAAKGWTARGWGTAITRAYALINAAQANANNCSKLVYNWTNTAGAPDFTGGEADLYSYDAVRTPWRIALDQYWSNSANANATMNEFGSFFRGVGSQNIKRQYNPKTGLSPNPDASSLFTTLGDVAIWSAPASTNLTGCGAAQGANTSKQAAYDSAVGAGETNGTYQYFNNYWQLMSLMLMSGNMKELVNSTGGSQTATCSDGILNNGESAIDCGGANCQACSTSCVNTAAYSVSSTFTHTVGGASGTDWNLWSNGSVSKSIYFYQGTTRKIKVQAKGSAASGVYAKFKVYVDGVQVGAETTTTGTSTVYSFTYNATSSKNRVVKVEFTNDLYVAPADRNLYLGTVQITCT